MSVPEISELKKVLIIRWGALGDLALCSAVFEDLRNGLPDVEMHLNVDPIWSELFAEDARFSRIITQKMRGSGFVSSLSQWLKLLKSERYDLIIDLQSNDRSRLYLGIARLLRIAPRYCVSTRNVYPYNLQVRTVDDRAHALDLYRVPLSALGIPALTSQPSLAVPDKAHDEASALLDSTGLMDQRFVILVPGSSLSGINKRWGEHHYIALGQQLLESHDVQKITVMGGPDELVLCRKIAEGIGDRAINLAGMTALSSIIPLVSASQGMISNDTGLAHLAAAAHRRIVVICGPTRADRVKPAGRHVRTLQAPQDCFLSHASEDCMAKITPQRVVESFFK